MKVARTYLGVARGTLHKNPKVIEFYAEAGHPEIKDDHVSYCAAFVGAILKECNLPHTGTLLALDYAKYGQHLTKPAIGAIFTMHRPGFTGAGHTGFVADFDDTHISSLGGNQGSTHKVCIDRIARSAINSYSWPPGVPLPV
jgi:uncharacterized protein (TIGR02594 family)